jgi:cyclase
MKPIGDKRDMFYGADRLTFDKATELRKNMTLAELILWKNLKNRALFKVKFRRQHPINIFIVDFYCHEFKLAIELEGEIHQNNKVHQYDSKRQKFIENLGIKILRFSNDQVIYNINIILEQILKEIKN